MRSVDCFLGLPFDIGSYSLQLLMVAQCTVLVPDELVFQLGETHIYNNHLEQVKTQIQRDPRLLPQIIINPEIIQLKGARRKDFETCLSVPGIRARVERWQKVKIKYYDLNFCEYVELFKNFEARVVQHELDHLDGIEFYDRISKDELKKIIGSIEKLRRGEIPKLDYKITHFTKNKK